MAAAREADRSRIRLARRRVELNQASELLVTSYEKGEFDFMSLAPSVADVEPTGVLAVVSSFNKPICR